MEVPTFHLAASFDTKETISGDVTLSWSQDNCVAVATNKDVLLYELNPFKEPRCKDMPFKVQAVRITKRIEHEVGADELVRNYDDLRSAAYRNAAVPDFDVYRMHFDKTLERFSDSSESESVGIRAVTFSPTGCSEEGGTVLAILTMDHRVEIFTKSSDGTLIKWMKAIDLSDILINYHTENKKSCVDLQLADFKSKLKHPRERQHASCVSCISWSDAKHIKSNGIEVIHFVSCTKNNFILIWQLELPICFKSKAVVMSCTKPYDGEIKCLTWLKSDTKAQSSLKLAIGGVDGRIMCGSINVNGILSETNLVWTQKDELNVSCMKWHSSIENCGRSHLLSAKGFAILHIEMTQSLQRLHYTILRDTHTFPIVSIGTLGPFTWLSASRDGQIAKVWLESTGERNTGTGTLKSAILSNSMFTPSSLFHETTHQVEISPSGTFIATLQSKPRVSRSIMAENASFLEIKTLCSGMKSFEMVCGDLRIDSRSVPQMDMIESIRQHLLHKEFCTDEEQNILLQACLEQFLLSQTNFSPSKWCLVKIYDQFLVSQKTNLQAMLLEVEKKLAAQQMIKVLRWWLDHKNSSASKLLPLQNIITWLKTHQLNLTEEHLKCITHVENDAKFLSLLPEVCSVTGETMLMSEDAKYGITESSLVQWPRCCLTFCTLQSFSSRKCEASGSRSMLVPHLNPELRDLLCRPSIYSGLSML